MFFNSFQCVTDITKIYNEFIDIINVYIQCKQNKHCVNNTNTTSENK